MMPLGVILAGGLARRMGGGDKGLLALGGREVNTPSDLHQHIPVRDRELLHQGGQANVHAGGEEPDAHRAL